MSTQRLPKELTHEKIRGIIDHYENQSGAEAAAEMELAFAEGRGYRTMHVPIEVASQVLELIASAERARGQQPQKPAGRVAESRKAFGKQ